MRKTILLVASDNQLAEKIKIELVNDGFEVTISFEGMRVFSQKSTANYHLILLDISLPKLFGFDLLKCFKECNATPVIMLSNREDFHDRLYAFEIGADEYLPNTLDERERKARINAIIRRSSHFIVESNRQTLDVNNISLCLAAREAYCGDDTLELTGLEFEVLHCLMANAGKIMAKEDISVQALGREISYYDRSIYVHISNIRRKIAKCLLQQNQNSVIKTIRGGGYVFLQESKMQIATR
jgi:two-component system response regulator CpxR